MLNTPWKSGALGELGEASAETASARGLSRGAAHREPRGHLRVIIASGNSTA